MVKITASPVKKRRGSAWKYRRAVAIARDGGCLFCGTKDDLSVHHIKPRALGCDDRPVNLVTLCRAHHTMIEQVGHWAIWAIGATIVRAVRLGRSLGFVRVA